MILVYSGALEEGVHQLKPELSLGGFPSDSQIPNDYLANVFSAASALGIQNKRRECKMIVLQNTTGVTVQDLQFTFGVEVDSICKYKVAFVNPTITTAGSCFEKIINGAALPLHGTFTSITDALAIAIASPLVNNAYLGIWLIREFDYTSADLKTKACSDWLTQLEDEDVSGPTEPNLIERLSIAIDYTESQASV